MRAGAAVRCSRPTVILAKAALQPVGKRSGIGAGKVAAGGEQKQVTAPGRLEQRRSHLRSGVQLSEVVVAELLLTGGIMAVPALERRAGRDLGHPADAGEHPFAPAARP